MIEASFTVMLVGVFLLVAGFGTVLVHRLIRATAAPSRDG